MAGIRLRKSVVAVLAVGLMFTAAVPAGAARHVGVDVAGASLWAAALDVRGLDQAETAQVRSLWAEFVTGLPAQSACLLAHPPRVEAKTGMSPRAAYAPGSATLFVKPGDLPRLVVFHELAHHLDFTCGAAEEIGAEFRRAQGISSQKAWWKEGSPVTWPAEFFANAVAISLGEHSRHPVTAAAVEVVENWAGKEPPPDPVPPLTLDAPGASVPRIF